MNNTQTNANINAKKRESALLYPKLSYLIQGCVFEIRKQYGPGQKEIIYQRLLEEKLVNKGLRVEKEKRINVYSQDSGKVIGIYQPDLLIEEKILLEINQANLPPKPTRNSFITI